jgi:hypothetical protein
MQSRIFSYHQYQIFFPLTRGGPVKVLTTLAFLSEHCPQKKEKKSPKKDFLSEDLLSLISTKTH